MTFMPMCIRLALITLALVTALLACQRAENTYAERRHDYSKSPVIHNDLHNPSAAGHSVKAIDLKALPDLDSIIPKLAEKQVVFIGETHDHFDHHLAQLEIIQRLRAIHHDLAIGVEYFQTPFQGYLDAYIAGELDEQAFLRKTEYFERWKFDYRLYRPIFNYARERKIPLLALNVPEEISRKVAHSGLQSLTDDERALIPSEIDQSDHEYRERLRAVFEQHRRLNAELSNFDYFVEAQLLWDETMAESAANYLRTNPDRHMVILAGSGHLVHGSGIPRRLTRRLPTRIAIVINAGEASSNVDVADFLLFPAKRELPPAGMLGVFMKKNAGGIEIGNLLPSGAAMTAGLKKGDLLTAVGGQSVTTFADVKIALLDKRPGDRVSVKVKRGDSPLIETEVVLKAPHP